MDKFFTINDIKIPNLAFGTGRLNDDKLVCDTVIEAVKQGYKHFDLAVDYMNLDGVTKGINYCIENKLIKREDLFLTLKISEPGYNKTIKIVEGLLNDLSFSYIDMVLIHYPWDFDPLWKKYVADTYRAIERLYRENKVKIIGVSNFSQEHFVHLLNYATIKPMVNQISVNPKNLRCELVNYLKDKKIAIEAYSPIMYIQDEFILKEIGQRHNKSFAQVALRWCLQKGYIPICSSKNADEIKENIDIYDFELSDEEMKYIDSLDIGMYRYEDAGYKYRLAHPDPNAEEYRPKVYTRTYNLFGFIPLIKMKKYRWSKTKWFFLNIPILRVITDDSV